MRCLQIYCIQDCAADLMSLRQRRQGTHYCTGCPDQGGPLLEWHPNLADPNLAPCIAAILSASVHLIIFGAVPGKNNQEPGSTTQRCQTGHRATTKASPVPTLLPLSRSHTPLYTENTPGSPLISCRWCTGGPFRREQQTRRGTAPGRGACGLPTCATLIAIACCCLADFGELVLVHCSPCGPGILFELSDARLAVVSVQEVLVGRTLGSPGPRQGRRSGH